MNKWQTIAKDVYGGGDYSYITDIVQAEHVGDTLFTFIMKELSTREGCCTRAEAVRRMNQAMADIQMVVIALEGPDKLL